MAKLGRHVRSSGLAMVSLRSFVLGYEYAMHDAVLCWEQPLKSKGLTNRIVSDVLDPWAGTLGWG